MSQHHHYHENSACAMQDFSSSPVAVRGVGAKQSRNRDQWLSLADFLTLENLRIVLQKRAQAGQAQRRTAQGANSAINFGGCEQAGISHAVPVGNTGTTSPRGAA